jgi:RHS repeat-associated protein
MNVLCLITTPLPPNTSLFTVHEKFDTLGRNQGYALSNNVGLITGTMQSFDQYGRLNQVAIDGISGAFTYGYLEGTHLQKTLAMPNGVTRTFGYEANRDLLKMIIHSNATERLVQRDFTFDGLGRLENRTLFRANATPVQPDAFAYNSRSELTNAIINANAFAYNFDPIGNRLAATEFGTNTAYTASALNQYTSINPINPVNPVENFNPEFDADGNQTLLKTTTGIWHVCYNAENRPVIFSNDTTVVSMSYDYMGRRFEYKEIVNSVITRYEHYLYRGYLQIAVLGMLNNGSVKHAIAWDPSEPVATRPLALQVGSNMFFYSFDQVKNVTELFDVSGALAATYDYSPFGQVVAFQITQSGNTALTQFSNPLTFSSEVSDSSIGIQYYNYRHLNTFDGRWVNRDPIGIRGGLNMYAFLMNKVEYICDFLGFTTGETVNVVSIKDIPKATVEITNVTSKKDTPKFINVHVKPKNIASGCELNFIQLAIKKNKGWQIDDDDFGKFPYSNPPFYYNWNPQHRGENGKTLKDAFVKSDGTIIFEDAPTEETKFYLFIVERCCTKYYKDVKNCDCCEKSTAKVLERFYWGITNGKTQKGIMDESIKKDMDAKLVDLVHNKTFTLLRCEKYIEDNLKMKRDSKWWWDNPGIKHTVEVILDN